MKRLKHDKHLNTSCCLSWFLSSAADVGLSFEQLLSVSSTLISINSCCRVCLKFIIPWFMANISKFPLSSAEWPFLQEWQFGQYKSWVFWFSNTLSTSNSMEYWSVSSSMSTSVTTPVFLSRCSKFGIFSPLENFTGDGIEQEKISPHKSFWW